MTTDLKIIKKLYGEAMMHFCRNTFPTILEKEGLLADLLQEHFAPSHMLYDDLNQASKIWEFKNFIFHLANKEKKEKKIIGTKTPFDLLKEVGYTLYECKSEEDIQSFRKYYAAGEELCTFNGGRLDQCYVFFAVKDNALDIKREKFINPERQDIYGTSVISIQFTCDPTHTLSIKNRYNHSVNNPDATFSNNLDLIVLGLTEAFERVYGLVQRNKNYGFEIPNYVQANDGRFYKYNYEIDNVYYCPDNVIINHFDVRHYEKEKYLVFDYFILDLESKELHLFDNLCESFADSIYDIEKIEIKKDKDKKEINILHKSGEITRIILDKQNRMLELCSEFVRTTGDFFLYSDLYLKKLVLPNLQEARQFFLCFNDSLETLLVPNLFSVGRYFLDDNSKLEEYDFSSLESIDIDFLSNCEKRKDIVAIQRVNKKRMREKRNRK